jgi:2'-5' RNA ligase
MKGGRRLADYATRTVLALFPQHSIEGLEDFRQSYINNPGKSIPIHLTIFYNFLLPHQLDQHVVQKLQTIAAATKSFTFQARPLASFPTSKVLYLSPVPVTPIEEITQRLYKAFPSLAPSYGFPVFHMTIALDNPQDKTPWIIDDYFSTFGSDPLPMTAHHLGLFAQYHRKWKQVRTFPLGTA